MSQDSEEESVVLGLPVLQWRIDTRAWTPFFWSFFFWLLEVLVEKKKLASRPGKAMGRADEPANEAFQTKVRQFYTRCSAELRHGAGRSTGMSGTRPKAPTKTLTGSRRTKISSGWLSFLKMEGEKLTTRWEGQTGLVRADSRQECAGAHARLWQQHIVGRHGQARLREYCQ